MNDFTIVTINRLNRKLLLVTHVSLEDDGKLEDAIKDLGLEKVNYVAFRGKHYK